MKEKSKIIKKTILSFSINLVVLIVIGAGALYFLIPQIKKETLSLKEKQTEMAIFQGRENNKADLEKNYQEIKPNLPKIMAALPSKYDLTQFVNDLETIAPDSSLRFEEKSPSPETLSFEIKLPGDLVSLTSFIKSLEGLPYYIKITSFEITPTTATIKAVLSVST